MTVHRRAFLTGLAAAFAAPAIVRYENIMPVRNVIVPVAMTFSCYLKDAYSVYPLSPEITPVGNGWFRYHTTFDATPGKIARVKLPSSNLTCSEVRLDTTNYPDGIEVNFDGLRIDSPAIYGAQVEYRTPV
jgi:hypothetical protein